MSFPDNDPLILDIAASVGLQKAVYENDGRPGRLAAFLNTNDCPDLTEVMGLEVRRSGYIDPGTAIVLRLWCAACGGEHDLTEHEGPLPVPRLTGILGFIS